LKRFLKSEAGATVIWILAALLIAAVAAPWVYQAGKNLGQVAATQELSPFWEWLGKACGRSKLERYFSRCFSGSVLLLLPFLFWRIRRIRAGAGVVPVKRTRVSWKSALTQIALGCLIAGGILWATGMILEGLGAYKPEPNATTIGSLMKRILIPAIAAPLLEEWLFRGVLLGLWLKFTKPLSACIGVSFFFAFVHFLAPPAGSPILNPAAPTAGFELLGKILLHFANPTFFVTDFATLFMVGMILAWARLRTGALWFSIGLHAGWIAAFKGFSILHRAVPDHALRPWGVGDSLRAGLIPMCALAVTALICFFVLKFFTPSNHASR
jgi:membrane protease YdiL (CAAX protease family)